MQRLFAEKEAMYMSTFMNVPVYIVVDHIYIFIHSAKLHVSIFNIPGPSKMPESLVRVQRLTGKSLVFHEADLCDKDSLRSVFAKVNI